MWFPHRTKEDVLEKSDFLNNAHVKPDCKTEAGGSFLDLK